MDGYILNPEPFLIARSEARATDDTRDFYRVELATVDDADAEACLVQGIEKAASALLSHVRNRLESHPTPAVQFIIDDALKEDVAARVLHSFGVNVSCLARVRRHLEFHGDGTAKLVICLIDHEMAARTAKELVRATLWDPATFAGTTFDQRSEGDQARSKIAAQVLQRYIIKGDAWDDSFLPTLRDKFCCATAFDVPRSTLFVKSLFATCCGRVGAKFNPEARKIEAPLATIALRGTTFAARQRGFASRGPSMSLRQALCDLSDASDQPSQQERLLNTLRPYDNVVATFIALRVVASMGTSSKLSASPESPLRAHIVDAEVTMAAWSRVKSPIMWMLVAAASVPEAARLVRDKALTKKCRNSYVTLFQTHISQTVGPRCRIAANVVSAYLDALPHFAPASADMLVSVNNVISALDCDALKTPQMIEAALKFIGAHHGQKYAYEKDDGARAWRSLSLRVSQLSRASFGENSSSTLLATTYWSFFVLVNVKNSDNARNRRGNDSAQALDEKELSVIRQYEDVVGRLHAADDKERRRLLGTDHYVTCTAKFAGLLMSHGEWVAGRALAVLCGKMVTWVPGLTTATIEEACAVCSRTADVTVAAKELQRVVMRRRARKGTRRVEATAELHRYGVRLLERWGFHHLVIERFCHLRLLTKHRILQLCERLLTVHATESYERCILESEFGLERARVVFDAGVARASLLISFRESLHRRLLHVQHCEATSRERAQAEAAGAFAAGWQMRDNVERQEVEADEVSQRIALCTDELFDAVSLLKAWVALHRDIDLQWIVLKQVTDQRRIFERAACATALAIAELAQRTALRRLCGETLRHAFVELAVSQKSSMVTSEAAEYSELLTEFRFLTHAATVDTVSRHERSRRRQHEKDVLQLHTSLLAVVGLSAATYRNHDLLLEHHAVVQGIIRVNVAHQEAIERSSVYTAALSAQESLRRKCIPLMRLSEFANVLHLGHADWLERSLRLTKGHQARVLMRIETCERREVIRSLTRTYPEYARYAELMSRQDGRIWVHENVSRSFMWREWLSGCASLVVYAEFLQRRRLLNDEARTRVPRFHLYRDRVLAQHDEARRRILADERLLHVAVMDSHCTALKRLLNHSALRDFITTMSDLLQQREKLGRAALLKHEQSASRTLWARSEAALRLRLEKKRDSAFVAVSIPYLVHVGAAQMFRAALAGHVTFLQAQEQDRRRLVHEHCVRAKTEMWAVAARGFCYRLEFDEGIERELLLRLHYLQDTCWAIRSSLQREAFTAAESLHIVYGSRTRIAQREAVSLGVVRMKMRLGKQLLAVEVVEDEHRSRLEAEHRRTFAQFVAKERDYRQVAGFDSEFPVRAMAAKSLAPLRQPLQRQPPIALLMERIEDAEDDARVQLQLRCAAQRGQLLQQLKASITRARSAPPLVTCSLRAEGPPLLHVRRHGASNILQQLIEDVAALDRDAPADVAHSAWMFGDLARTLQADAFVRHAEVPLSHPAVQSEVEHRSALSSAERAARADLVRRFNAMGAVIRGSERRGHASKQRR
jgi:hypothetical protein